MPAISTAITTAAALLSSSSSSSFSSPHSITTCAGLLTLNFPDALLRLRSPGGRWGRRRRKASVVVLSKPSSAELSAAEEEWIKKLPDKKKPLYAHSLPCIEAWLKKLGFRQSRDDRAVWLVEKLDWHAQLSLDVTDLYIRYLKSGPGNLEKDVERRFSYALSREDIENAILGGP